MFDSNDDDASLFSEEQLRRAHAARVAERELDSYVALVALECERFQQLLSDHMRRRVEGIRPYPWQPLTAEQKAQLTTVLDECLQYKATLQSARRRSVSVMQAAVSQLTAALTPKS